MKNKKNKILLFGLLISGSILLTNFSLHEDLQYLYKLTPQYLIATTKGKLTTLFKNIINFTKKPYEWWKQYQQNKEELFKKETLSSMYIANLLSGHSPLRKDSPLEILPEEVRIQIGLATVNPSKLTEYFKSFTFLRSFTIKVPTNITPRIKHGAILLKENNQKFTLIDCLIEKENERHMLFSFDSPVQDIDFNNNQLIVLMKNKDLLLYNFRDLSFIDRKRRGKIEPDLIIPFTHSIFDYFKQICSNKENCNDIREKISLTAVTCYSNLLIISYIDSTSGVKRGKIFISSSLDRVILDTLHKCNPSQTINTFNAHRTHIFGGTSRYIIAALYAPETTNLYSDKLYLYKMQPYTKNNPQENLQFIDHINQKPVDHFSHFYFINNWLAYIPIIKDNLQIDQSWLVIENVENNVKKELLNNIIQKPEQNWMQHSSIHVNSLAGWSDLLAVGNDHNQIILIKVSTQEVLATINVNEPVNLFYLGNDIVGSCVWNENDELTITLWNAAQSLAFYLFN